MTTVTDTTIPSWNNTHIYTGFDDPAIEADIKTAQADTAELASITKTLSSPLTSDQFDAIEQCILICDRVVKSIFTMGFFAMSGSSVDITNKDAAKLDAKTDTLKAEIDQVYAIVMQLVIEADTETYDALMTREQVAVYRFALDRRRIMGEQRLPVAAEEALSAVQPVGLSGWQKLYSDLAGSLKCVVNGKEVGLAAANNLLDNPDAHIRLEAWQGIQKAWKENEITAAAIINAINGWRHQENKLRSTKKPIHFLDVTCHRQQIERKTLTTLMDTVYEKRDIAYRALNGMAKVLGVEKLGPQDCRAVYALPEQRYYSFEEGLELVACAFDRFDPEMGEFVRMMYRKGWIEAGAEGNRRSGAYCGKFQRVNEPRVFMTWGGSLTSIITLAHELGHAWHNWVMRDLPRIQASYPFTLGETASIFAETLVRDALFTEADNDEARLSIAWEDAGRIEAFLLNIPSRFEFEKGLAEQRQQSYVPASELCELMEQSWRKWYQNSLTGYDSMYWAAKIHFSLANVSFYNYPYLFGYLFSLGVYAQKDKQGDSFRMAYRELLRDTGRMTAEELVEKHLGKDIRKPEFWLDSLEIVEGLVSRFEGLVDKQSS
ncbi:M3 family oligoendopeptidase [Parendozoicomonas haliclonae]|uniref:Oligoendopeptidase F, plasmid n=1 Tax=Parendozoicomonas haliclonae TaxID=1960125 RepID=A0A1X7AIL2_9GAMM|nr:M3 family oligoendopeptidase [Parendozoicomonas haliclonae]SMA44144.1 Oligoendopeptidase F, plasmid [Parendozoicomonas haliclonae]